MCFTIFFLKYVFDIVFFHLFPSPRVQLLLLIITILPILSVFLLGGELSSPMTTNIRKKKVVHLQYIFPYKKERIACTQQ